MALFHERNWTFSAATSIWKNRQILKLHKCNSTFPNISAAGPVFSDSRFLSCAKELGEVSFVLKAAWLFQSDKHVACRTVAVQIGRVIALLPIADPPPDKVPASHLN
jgi:hypothetical protein